MPWAEVEGAAGGLAVWAVPEAAGAPVAPADPELPADPEAPAVPADPAPGVCVAAGGEAVGPVEGEDCVRDGAGWANASGAPTISVARAAPWSRRVDVTGEVSGCPMCHGNDPRQPRFLSNSRAPSPEGGGLFARLSTRSDFKPEFAVAGRQRVGRAPSSRAGAGRW